MEFLEALQRTWDDVQKAEIPEYLHAAALSAGLKHYALARGVVQLDAPPAGDGYSMAKRIVATGDAGSRVAAESGLAREAIDELLYFDAEGMPGINGGPRRLGNTNAERSRTVALLLAGARYLANDEIEVPLDQIRDACKKFGIYDSNNFASYMSEVPGFTLSGPRASRVLRGKSDAPTRFRQRVSELLGVAE